MLLHYPSFNKHFSLSKRDKCKVDTKPSTKHTTKHCLLHNRNSECGWRIWNTCWRLIPWWNVSKFVVLKHFGRNFLPKESSALFLFTIYMLKSVFCWDISVSKTWVWSMCRNLSGNAAENDGNTKKYALKISPRFIALRAVEFVSYKTSLLEVCRYKTFWGRIFVRRTFLLFRCVVCMLNFVFWWHSLLEIEFKSRGDVGSDRSMHSGITHER